ncbi:MAG: excinuclease ABC subunit UvrC [Chitinispirillaceae bacterium]|jgi:excinuclease ABC subunit C
MPTSSPPDARWQRLVQLARTLPENPGVYIMKNSGGTPLYIGKAASLRSRVRSYFFDRHEERAQIPIMLQQLETIEWIATNTESEALILEANLIRTHIPRYNIDLRDDKHYPYLKVTAQEPFPRLLIVRRVEEDGARYLGPYTDVSAMRRLAEFAKRIFKLCDCTNGLLTAKKTRPCLNYAMHRCSGVCAGKISPTAYREQINYLLQFLSGKRNGLLGELTQRMNQASADLRFEDAALFRDQINLIRDASRFQKVDLALPGADCDVFGFAATERHGCLAVLLFREGLLMSSHQFVFKRELWNLPAESRDSLILQFYLTRGREVPAEIILPEDRGFDAETLQPGIEKLLKGKTLITIPRKGTKRRLVAMAEKNAQLHLLQKAPPGGADDCLDLQKALRLPKIPETIEAFDISNLGESFCVAAMVQFKSGAPNKSGYRRYKIKSVEGQNDFAMMMEVVSRRLARLRNENAPFPDLILIDGGRGQLHAAMEALSAFEDPPPIAALAKKEEIIFSPCIEEPVRLPPAHPARRLAERVRDEAHRFAITYHRKKRDKQFSRSGLEDLPGIGPKTAKLLLKTFGSMQRIKAAAVEEIAKVGGFTVEQAGKVKETVESMR